MSDLDIVQSLMSQFSLIPPTPSTIIKYRESEDAFEQYTGLSHIERMDDFMIRLKVFIKFTFGEQSEYMANYQSIDFFPSEKQKNITAKNIHKISEETWQESLANIKSLLKHLRIEVEIKTMKSESQLWDFKKDERKRLSIQSFLWFYFTYVLVLFPSNNFFFKAVIDWKHGTIFNPLTWVNKDVFANGELVIGIWITINAFLISRFMKWMTIFTNWYYNRFKMK